MSFWVGRRVLVTGGASFIGSHVTEALLARGARVRVIDDLSSGRLDYINSLVAAGDLEFIRADLRDQAMAKTAVAGQSVVIHLAADHGGRGYVDLHQGACAGNLVLDGILFDACLREGVERVAYASSGCVYPNYLQSDSTRELYLTEDMVGPPFDADNMYGWAKLMGEMSLRAFARERGIGAVSCRYFTVYGERGKEDHAVIAMIARALTKQDPFEVWGTGEQIRNWTYVGDIVEGTLLAAEHVNDGSAINLGTMERTRVIDAVREVLRYTGHAAEIRFRPEMPTGPLNRVADNSRARQLTGWEPRVKFRDGLHRTIDWYFSTKEPREVASRLELALTER